MEQTQPQHLRVIEAGEDAVGSGATLASRFTDLQGEAYADLFQFIDHDLARIADRAKELAGLKNLLSDGVRGHLTTFTHAITALQKNAHGLHDRSMGQKPPMLP